MVLPLKLSLFRFLNNQGGDKNEGIYYRDDAHLLRDAFKQTLEGGSAILRAMGSTPL